MSGYLILETTFRKAGNAVINTNSSGLRAAKMKKKEVQKREELKNNEIKTLIDTVNNLESKIDLVLKMLKISKEHNVNDHD